MEIILKEAIIYAMKRNTRIPLIPVVSISIGIYVLYGYMALRITTSVPFITNNIIGTSIIVAYITYVLSIAMAPITTFIMGQFLLPLIEQDLGCHPIVSRSTKSYQRLFILMIITIALIPLYCIPIIGLALALAMNIYTRLALHKHFFLQRYYKAHIIALSEEKQKKQWWVITFIASAMDTIPVMQVFSAIIGLKFILYAVSQNLRELRQ